MLFQLNENDHRRGDNGIDRVIPVICPPEGTDHDAGQDKGRIRQGLPEKTAERRMRRRGHFLLPDGIGIENRRRGKYEDQVDVMGMQIPENRRIRRKLMDRLIRRLRKIAYVARRRRKPVVLAAAPAVKTTGSEVDLDIMVDE